MALYRCWQVKVHWPCFAKDISHDKKLILEPGALRSIRLLENIHF